MDSNDYKSMVGLWKKLSIEERKKFVRDNVDKSMISNCLVYYGFSKGRDNSFKDKLKKNIDKLIGDNNVA